MRLGDGSNRTCDFSHKNGMGSLTKIMDASNKHEDVTNNNGAGWWFELLRILVSWDDYSHGRIIVMFQTT